MLYKVTPMMPAPGTKEVKQAREPGAPRKRRKTAIYDADGAEVLITLMCLKCKSMKPLSMFGLRKMADGAIRNQPWCRGCRSHAGTPKPKKGELSPEASAVQSVSAAPAAFAAGQTEVSTTEEVTQPLAAALQQSSSAPEEVSAAKPSAESSAMEVEETSDVDVMDGTELSAAVVASSGYVATDGVTETDPAEAKPGVSVQPDATQY